MKTPLDRIREGAAFLLLVSVISVVGYRYLARDYLKGPPWIESVHWFVITVSSVGYTEDSKASPALQLFTILVIMVGMSAAIYTIGGLVQMMFEGEIERALGHSRMTREIKQLKDHTIVCGFGRIGQIVANKLTHNKTPLLVIDNNPEHVTEAQNAGYLVLNGDATQEDVLISGGVERAKNLICGLPSDADNMFIALTSRNLSDTIRIISRGEQPSSEKKLQQAGADSVVLTAALGAERIARLVTRPYTAELIERVVDRDILDVELDELLISDSTPLAGHTVRDAETHRKHRLLVVAVSRPDAEPIFNPDADYVFEPGQTIIVMGRTEDIAKFRKTYKI